MPDFIEEAKSLFPYTQELRRDFHLHPELGFEEYRTAGIVGKELQELGLEVSTGIGKTGVVALLESDQPGPVVLARFDMDALPIEEETGAEYTSRNPGKMHACGHDGHTAIGLTVARILDKYKDDLKGTVKFVFQPAEEGLGGAEAMVADGVLENPKPDLSLALHLWNEKPVGWFCVTDGPAMAASETFKVLLTGKGGHGAKPHNTIDPVFAAAQIINGLQSIVSRNVHPLESAVVSITTVHGGDAFNVIPQTVELTGTIRTFLPEIRVLVLKRFEEIVTGTAASHQCDVEITIDDITPAVINNSEVAKEVFVVAEDTFPGSTILNNFRTMGSEDMAFMMDDIPGTYFFVGSSNPDEGLDYGHHHPKFDFDEQALINSGALMSAAIYHFLTK